MDGYNVLCTGLLGGHERAAVRAAAVRAAGRLKLRQAVARIASLAQTEQEWAVRAAATWALPRLGGVDDLDDMESGE